MKLVGLLLMLREEVLAEIIRPVGYSNVVRLCLQVAFPTLLRNRFQFLSALHTQFRVPPFVPLYIAITLAE